LFLGQCPRFISIYLVRFIGCPDVNQLLLGVLRNIFMPNANVIYNHNQACVNWSKRSTTKGLRHIQMKEKRVREYVASTFVKVCHIDGKVNLVHLFTKEMKDTTHFIELRDRIMCPRIILAPD
jgi:hypothetical protein